MTQPRYAAVVMRAMLLTVMVAGCGSPSTPATADKPKAASAPAKPTLSLEAKAAAFVSAAASETTDQVQWDVSTLAVALVSVRTASQMGDELQAAAEGGEDPIESMIRLLSTSDIKEQTAKNQAAFVAMWKGDTECEAKPKPGSAYDPPPKAILARLPDALQKASATLETGKAFEVTCKNHNAVVMLDDAGKVLAFEPPREKHSELELDALSEENRFVGYMNEPDEVPE